VTSVRVAPFRALRYQTDRVGDPGAVWAPPYDVISAERAAELRERSAYNFVRITNPAGDPPGRYEDAARTLKTWIADGVLAQDEQPAFYVHKHAYEYGGDRLTRSGIWALLKLADFDEGVVLPHERTMKGPKADRLALMRACGAQLSPVFCICSDPQDRVGSLLGDLASERPALRTEFPAGESHEIWRVEGREALEQLSASLNEQTFLIADGHHRYETALANRDELIAGGASRDGRGAHEHVLVHVVPESDPGLLLLPTHRVIAGGELDWDGAAQGASGSFEIVRLDDEGIEAALQALEEEAGRPTFVVVTRESGGLLMRLRQPDALSGVSSVAFHDVFLSESVGLAPEEQLSRVSYVKDPAEALRAVESGSAEAAALLAAPKVAQVREAVALGERLPTKSTFFWPKVPSGVAVHVFGSR
jgi:uncharacterized protein (DUF1015 family)